MKLIFQTLARYNLSVNESLKEILAGLPKEQLFKETNAFYHSIFEACVHLLQSDIAWLSRYKAAFPDNNRLKNNPLAAMDPKSLGKEFESEYRKIFKTREDADNLIEQFINDLADEDFTRTFRYTNYRGETTERALWKTLLQMFNHHTHHRGQIAAFLDIMGIKNDYSTLLTRV